MQKILNGYQNLRPCGTAAWDILRQPKIESNSHLLKCYQFIRHHIVLDLNRANSKRMKSSKCKEPSSDCYRNVSYTRSFIPDWMDCEHNAACTTPRDARRIGRTWPIVYTPPKWIAVNGHAADGIRQGRAAWNPFRTAAHFPLKAKDIVGRLQTINTGNK